MARLNDTEAIVRRGLRPPMLKTANEIRIDFRSAEAATARGEVTSRLPNGPRSAVGPETNASIELCKE